jgi:hypothetical protein
MLGLMLRLALQVLRVSKRGTLITLYYHVNGLCGENLSLNDSEALQIAFEASDEEVMRHYPPSPKHQSPVTLDKLPSASNLG